MVTDSFMKRFKAGEVLYGPFSSLSSCELVEIIGLAGFDFTIIDGEHGPNDPLMAVSMLRAAESRGLTAMTRVPNALPSTILRFLDIGSAGIMVPMVNDAETARAVARAARYHPRGGRGYAAMRSADYGFLSVPDHIAKINAETFVQVQAETVEAIGNIEAIAAVEGVDSIFIGTFDLSQTMGIPGQVTDPRMVAAIEKAVKAIRAAGKVPGIFAGSIENAKRYVGMGFQFIAYSVDLDLFAGAAKDAVKKLKG